MCPLAIISESDSLCCFLSEFALSSVGHGHKVLLSAAAKWDARYHTQSQKELYSLMGLECILNQCPQRASPFTRSTLCLL